MAAAKDRHTHSATQPPEVTCAHPEHREKKKASVTDLQELRELDALISSRGGLSAFRGYGVRTPTTGGRVAR